MSSDSEQPSHTPVNPDAEIARLKRRLAASQAEIRELSEKKTKKPPCVNISSSLLFFIDLFLAQPSQWDAPFVA